jgi:hypothetical protein
MSWTSHILLRALLIVVSVTLSAGQSFAQWFTGDLRGTNNRADYVIVTPQAYAGVVQPLATYRASHNHFAVMTVLMDSIITQFPRATSDSSLRAFVTWMLTHWQNPKPQYLLIAGNGNVIPTHMEVSDLHDPPYNEDSVAIDQWFVNELGGVPQIPMMAMGRFPARSAGELTTMVNKTLAYEQSTAGSWARRAIAVADSGVNGDSDLYEAVASNDLRSLASRWPDTISVHVRPDSPFHKSGSAFRHLWGDGTAIVDLIGRINARQFSQGAYFTSADIDSLPQGSPCTILFLGGGQSFAQDTLVPLAVAALVALERGAVCAIAPSGLMYQGINMMFEEGIFEYLAHHPDESVGKAWLVAETGVPDSYERRRTMFGDPALLVKANPTASTVTPRIELPGEMTLDQNYPNPFNPTTTIRYGLPAKAQVQLAVYNLLGQHIATLVEGVQSAGYHEVQMDGSTLSSGMYFYRLQMGQLVLTRKLVLVR